MPPDIREAERMLDLFTSVGARDFVVTKTDIEQNVIWGKRYTAAEVHRQLPAMVRTAAIRRPHHLASGETVMAGENLIIRPTGPDVAFIQLDDLSATGFLLIKSGWGKSGAARPRRRGVTWHRRF
jgi:hypothetical protein